MPTEGGRPCDPRVSITLANICRYGQAIFLADGNRRHAGLAAAALDDGQNQLAVLVTERDLGAQQVRTAEIASA